MLSTGGSPLDQTTRTEMEARLGADLPDVRIHEAGAARASAAELGARAYTSGSHVVIGEGGSDSTPWPMNSPTSSSNVEVRLRGPTTAGDFPSATPATVRT